MGPTKSGVSPGPWPATWLSECTMTPIVTVPLRPLGPKRLSSEQTATLPRTLQASGSTGGRLSHVIPICMINPPYRAEPAETSVRAGGGGMLATDIVSKANPDGYTLIILSAAYAMNPAVRKLPYDPVKAIEFVMKLGDGPTILTVGPALPVDSVKALLAAAKSKPGQIIFGTSGGFQYFATALLRTLSKEDFNIVLYKGTAPALIDVIGGQTHASIAPIVPSLPHMRSGKLKALAMGTLKRSSMFPDLPTLDQLGVKGFDASNWYTIAVPPGTPRAIISKLYDEIAAYMRAPETVKQFTAMGGEVDIQNTEAVRAFIPAEIAKWRKVAIDAKMPRETQ